MAYRPIVTMTTSSASVDDATAACSPRAPCQRVGRNPSGATRAEQLSSPALDRLGHGAERAAARGQLVAHPHRRTGLDGADDDRARLQLLEPRRQRLGADAHRLRVELAEAERARLQQ